MHAGVFEEKVRDRAQFSHMVHQTEHLKERMLERDITFRQVLIALRRGTAEEEPSWNPGTASYEGTMIYYGTGRRIAVRCAIRGGDLYVFAITAY